MKSAPDQRVERWFLLYEEDCCISTITLGELSYGIAKFADGIKKSNLLSQIAEWRIRFSERTYGFDAGAAITYGDLLAVARAAGKPMSIPDAQIAAIARHRDFNLCTRNTSDFQTTGLLLINPWD